MSEWKHPTLADTGATGELRCRCGRTKQPDEMLEVRSLGVGEAFLCGGCVEDLLRIGAVDHLTLHRRVGAPVEWLAGFEAKLRQGPLLRSGLPAKMWGEMLADHLDAKQPPENRWVTLVAVEQARLAALAVLSEEI